ncbi:MAG: PDZ domain-containing protein [Eubacteriales bacterium]|nr:PDZ domain-containing protein [Eubacteriales bacterium]
MGEDKNFHSDEDSRQEEEYQFINQTIRKKPYNRKKLLIHIGIVILSGVAAGLIAVAILAAAFHDMSRELLKQQESARITIPADTDPDDTAAAVSVSTVQPETEEENADDQAADETEHNETTDKTDGSEIENKEADKSETAEVKEENNEAKTGENAEEEENSDDKTGENSDDPSLKEEAENYLTPKQYEHLYAQLLELAEENKASMVQVTGIFTELDYFNQDYENAQQVSGTIIYDAQNSLYILTEYRVIEGAEKILVTFCDGTNAEATLQKQDYNTGLAVVLVDKKALDPETAEELKPATLGNSYAMKIGDAVIATGNLTDYSDSFSFGVITSFSGKVSKIDKEYNLFTTDMIGTPNGSGVLLNLRGEVIGIIVQGIGGSNATLSGYAVSQLKGLIQNLSNGEYVPYMGIIGRNVTEEISERSGIPAGVLVTDVVIDSPAMLAGIKSYDVITSIGGNPIRTMKAYEDILRNLKPDTVITVTAMRKGIEGYTEVEFPVTITQW